MRTTTLLTKEIEYRPSTGKFSPKSLRRGNRDFSVKMLKRTIEQSRNKTLSELILWVKLEADTAPAWIGRFFNTHLGRLTARRREAIVNTMPRTIAATKKTSRMGNTYFKVSDNELENWLTRVRHHLH